MLYTLRVARRSSNLGRSIVRSLGHSLIGSAVIAAAVLASPAIASAQTSTSLVPLQVRVRLTSANPAAVPPVRTGTVARITSDTVVILEDKTGAELPIALFSLRKFEKSMGRQRRAGQGALYGFLAGAASGVALTLAACGAAEGGCDTSGGDLTAPFALAMGLGGGLGGTVIGAVIGSFIRKDRWQEVPLAALQVRQ